MPQHHVIRRQIVEVTVSDQATARRVATMVSDLLQSRVAPVLERALDDLADPRQTRRIDRLELDLGHLDLDAVAEQLPARLATALASALGNADVPAARRPTSQNAGGAVRSDAADAAPQL